MITLKTTWTSSPSDSIAATRLTRQALLSPRATVRAGIAGHVQFHHRTQAIGSVESREYLEFALKEKFIVRIYNRCNGWVRNKSQAFVRNFYYKVRC